MKLTFLGHGAWLIESKGMSIVLDPFITPNELTKDIIDINLLKPEYILITHGHMDHIADVETIAENAGSTIISNYEIVTWYGKKGYTGHPMNHGGSWNFEFGNVKYVTAVHSSDLPDGSYGGNPGGFVISNEEATVYFAGDTALTMDMKLIPITSPPLDAVILPIGDNFTMGYKDAAVAAEFVKCNKVIGCHFDTFGYIKVNKQDAIAHFKEAGKQLILPSIGTSIDL